jgi:excisionase family DNA binding protein
MKKDTFTTSDIARISRHSRETVKRWLEKGEIKGYRVGPAGHWRVLPNDLASFLEQNNIPFPDPGETGYELNGPAGMNRVPPFCWEFFRGSMSDHVRSNGRCEDCLVYKTKSLNCRTLRKEIGHKKIFCSHSCEECRYYRFLQRETG